MIFHSNVRDIFQEKNYRSTFSTREKTNDGCALLTRSGLMWVINPLNIHAIQHIRSLVILSVRTKCCPSLLHATLLETHTLGTPFTYLPPSLPLALPLPRDITLYLRRGWSRKSGWSVQEAKGKWGKSEQRKLQLLQWGEGEKASENQDVSLGNGWRLYRMWYGKRAVYVFQ